MKKFIICLFLTVIFVVSVFAGGTAEHPSGVYVSSGTFEMNGGTISGNTAQNGGGVYLAGGTFTMNGGTITGNTANSGGGVYVNSGTTFIMRDGIITGNTARENGGGLFTYGTFTKSGGTITGYSSDQNNGNVVRDEAGNVFARRGHAAWINENRRKETTAGPGLNLSGSTSTGWDN
jgi:hypothetical protein